MVDYFLTHILPWIALALGIISVGIMIYHCRKGGECYWKEFCFKKKNKQIEEHLVSDVV